MAIASNFPNIRPSLLLDFANTKRLDPRVSFTRASTGRYYDGVTVAKAEENLFLYSQQFDDSYWSKTDAVVTANSTAAPDGTTTADTITEGTSGNQSVARNVAVSAANAVVVFSIFVKKSANNDWVRMVIGDQANVGTNFIRGWFDVNAGVVGSVTTGGTGASSAISIVSVGNGWYRCILTGGLTNTSAYSMSIRSASADASTTVVSDATYFLWGAQLEQRSAVTAYTATTTQPITNYIPVLLAAPAGVARFDHVPTTGVSQGLLIEEQRTNFCLDSQNLAAGDRGSSTGWYAITRASITSNAVVAPDGTLTGNKIVANTDNNTHFAVSRTTAGSTTNTNPITFSGYLKAGELTTGSFLIIEGTTYSRNSVVYFDLSAGTATTPSTANGAASASATITPVGNGWYRCTLTVTLGGTDTRVEARVYPTNSTTTQTFVGNNFDGIYAWGFQIEAGAFPTSYIPTTTTALTRNADVASMTETNFSSWFNASEGTVYAEGLSNSSSISATILAISDGSNNNRYQLGTGASNTVWNPFVVTSGTTVALLTQSVSFPPQTNAKIIMAYKTNDFSATTAGTSVTTDTSGNLPVVDRLLLGSSGSGTISWNSHIRRIAFYPQRLANAQLQALTA
jgi:hypothetical protein